MLTNLAIKYLKVTIEKDLAEFKHDLQMAELKAIECEAQGKSTQYWDGERVKLTRLKEYAIMVLERIKEVEDV